jgi:hypothetical protein
MCASNVLRQKGINITYEVTTESLALQGVDGERKICKICIL